VIVDGVDVRKCRIRSLREKIAIVLQDPVLFPGHDRREPALRPSRRHAGRHQSGPPAPAHARVHLSPGEGLRHGNRWEAGGSLSGENASGLWRGPRHHQERADPDPRRAALVTRRDSEEIVFAALRRLRAGRTTIVIAHRLSTVRDADCILVLDGGRIAAKGKHEELLQSSQLYRRMCARLSVGKSLDDPETVDELIEAAKR
jgi:subfamily B ATP-binding cassette protein MsbA